MSGRQYVALLLIMLSALAAVHFYDSSIAASESNENYANALAGCHRNNPRSVALYRLVNTFAERALSPRVERESQASKRKIESAPHVRPDGGTYCSQAIHEP